ncbi:MAG: FAD-dependent thymidylate synthase [Selenomonadaceae bacterium]|nr:FAD-dependent thymidylate synthase [Selenomonadaceae bacterium]MBR1806236.1 FAD-dependent thymidylate synthase [Selenomonadaceae bacterium]
MKIIEPSAELIDEINPEEILRKIERCGKVSRQSELGDAENFVRKIIKLGHESVLEHVSLTFKIVCDRAIMAELTRHRLASFTVESTRYVKYEELTVIAPFGRGGYCKDDPNELDDEAIRWNTWEEQILQAEDTYFILLERGATPEIARAVLPLCLATELYMTANLRELRHILKLRTAKAAHPQMRQVAGQILNILREKLPVIVEDI